VAAKSSEIPGLNEALAALRAGELVVYPTETFYALGADPFSEAAMERLFALKGRDPEKPVALIAADAPMAFALARSISESARALADAFWPGPLTLVLTPRDGIPAPLVGPTGGVGVRVSPNPVARALSAGLGRPITATSANLSGQPPASTLSAARAAFGDRVRVYLEGGTLGASAPSTVVTCEDEGFRILRAGAIVEREIIAALSTGALK
jgi:L-threonylcarbamoyladenylate synthase